MEKELERNGHDRERRSSRDDETCNNFWIPMQEKYTPRSRWRSRTWEPGSQTIDEGEKVKTTLSRRLSHQKSLEMERGVPSREGSVRVAQVMLFGSVCWRGVSGHWWLANCEPSSQLTHLYKRTKVAN